MTKWYNILIQEVEDLLSPLSTKTRENQNNSKYGFAIFILYMIVKFYTDPLAKFLWLCCLSFVLLENLEIITVFNY